MIISRRYKYLFVEVPNTGSTAISRELRTYYDGVPVLHKHASLPEFRAIASADERRFFVFGTVRHPLDAAVTQYFKLKTNHRGKFTDPRRLGGPALTPRHVEQFELVYGQQAHFEQFFRGFNRAIYNNYYLVLHKEFGAVMRFEHLQEDFARVLSRLGIEQVRPLPTVNRTGGKEANFWSYYPPHLWPAVKKGYGPFMRRWGYDIPPEWGELRVPLTSHVRFQSMDVLSTLAGRLLHIGPNSRAPFVNRVREILRAVWS